MDEDRVAGMLAEMRPHLNELQWRLLLAAQARSMGRGGIKRVATLAGVHPDTVGRGARELEAGIEPAVGSARLGRGGPGRRRQTLGLVPALDRLVDIRLPAVTRSRHCGGRPS